MHAHLCFSAKSLISLSAALQVYLMLLAGALCSAAAQAFAALHKAGRACSDMGGHLPYAKT